MSKGRVFIACSINLLLALCYMLFVQYEDNIPTVFWSNLYYFNDKILICILVFTLIKYQTSSIELALSILFIIFQISLIIFIFVSNNAYENYYLYGLCFSGFITLIYLVLTLLKFIK